jgi:HAMP domain-containing protein
MSLYIARPIKIGNPACLDCHSTPAAAPGSLVRAYGKDGGFGWKLDEIVGAQIVSVPMSVPIQRARLTLYTALGALVVIFVAMFIILNVMLNRLVIKPIKQMGSAADAISRGEFAVGQLDASRTDEVGQLAQSFNRMTKSLAAAMKLINTTK